VGWVERQLWWCHCRTTAAALSNLPSTHFLSFLREQLEAYQGPHLAVSNMLLVTVQLWQTNIYCRGASWSEQLGLRHLACAHDFRLEALTPGVSQLQQCLEIMDSESGVGSTWLVAGGKIFNG
jgi:hypothetical protein